MNRLEALFAGLTPGDTQEARDLQEVRGLLSEGRTLYREEVDRPDPHLVAYTLVTDGSHLLLCHHRKAGLWLPLGGHVEPDEDPCAAAQREIAEELGVALPLVQTRPFFVTLQRTVGPRPHRDLSLWYLFQGDPAADYQWDHSEFHAIDWFSPNQIPAETCEPQIWRALDRLRDAGHIRP